MKLSPSTEQIQIATLPVDRKVFLEGIAGSGKTTAGTLRLIHLLEQGVQPRSIIVLVPQRSLANPYYDALHQSNIALHSEISIITMYGLARRMIDLYWPLINEDAGFTKSNDPPIYLTIETAQYFMSKLVAPKLEEGYFDGIAISPNRLYSQILDNLNKSAVVGYPHTEFGERLNKSWLGEQTQRHAYAQAQECAKTFRNFCLDNNLLDFSLQMEVFTKHLWGIPLFQEHLEDQYRHMIFDNLEEDTPVTHDLLLEWLPSLESALLIYDTDGGFRTFLGADPISANRLKPGCDDVRSLTDSFVTAPEMQAFGYKLAAAMRFPAVIIEGDPIKALTHNTERYFTELLDWACNEIAELILNHGVSPNGIVILAPFMPDALRFQIETRFEELGIPYRTHRPSRALREEPATRTLLALAKIAHPTWCILPDIFDTSYAFQFAIDDLDLIRAKLLTEKVMNVDKNGDALLPFDEITPEIQERVSFAIGERYSYLRNWLLQYSSGPPLEFDHFLARFFGEVLSQPGFGFHSNIDAGGAAARLIESVRKFRWMTQKHLMDPGITLGQEFVEMVDQGLIAAQYLRDWGAPITEAVLVSPAFTFLMSNRPVEYQFWLNVGSNEWWRRINQPLTHPYVLSRNWSGDRHWQDDDELQASRLTLYRLTQGLIRRCIKKIYLGFNDIGPFGYEERGPLLRFIHTILRSRAEANDV